MTLPSEIQRAKYLTERLHSAVATAKKFGLPKVRLEIEIAEELVQLLADSLKTIHQFELVEFDGKIKPNERQRLPAPPMTLGLKFRLIHDWQFRTNNDVFTCK